MNTSMFHRTVRLGTAQGFQGEYSVYCAIKIADGRLSITGVEGPTRNGNCYGSCGQIVSSLDPATITPAPGWDRAKIQRFLDVWNRWHLNDMRAGSPRQEQYLRERIGEYIKEKEAAYVSHYEWATRVLADAGLNPDMEHLKRNQATELELGERAAMGYKYGSDWLTEPLPPDVVVFLESLPVADKTPAWV